MFEDFLVHSPRWSWPLRSQSGFPRLRLPRRSPLPSWSSCPPSYRSQPFLSAEATGELAEAEYSHATCVTSCFVEQLCSESGVVSLTFAAFLTFGSGLGGAGFCKKKMKEIKRTATLPDSNTHSTHFTVFLRDSSSLKTLFNCVSKNQSVPKK